MAITNATLPETVSLARGPVELKLTSNLPTSGTPINRLRLTVAGSPAVGETITLTYGEVEETIEVKTASDDTGRTISVQGALSLADYGALLAEELRGNYALFLNFEIEYELQGAFHYVYLSPRYTTAFTWSTSGSLSNITATPVVGTNTAYQDNPGLVALVEVYDDDADAWGDPIIHSLPILRSSEEVIFDLRNDFVLRHGLPPTNTIGSSGSNFAQITDNIVKYRLRYAERQGRPSVIARLTDASDDLFALFGTNSFFSQYEDFWSYWEVNGRFLTPQPKTKRVAFDQPEWLYWLGRSNDYSPWTLKVRAYRRSGAVSDYSYGGGQVFFVGECWAIKTGFTQLNLPLDSADPITYYEVYLDKKGAVASETFTYYLTGACGEFERYFLFGNSLGGCDTIRATGKWLTSLEHSTQEGQRVTDETTLSDSRGEDFHYNRSGRAVYEGSVGYISAARAAYLQELLLTPEAVPPSAGEEMESLGG